MKLWHVEFMIADKHLHSTMLYLEGKAYNVKHHPVKNGADEEEPKKKVKKEGRKHNKDLPTQTDWLQQHLKEGSTSSDMRDAWIMAGYPREQLYGALSRLVKMNRAKKLANGTYKLIGGA